eukprot:1525279-Rhodomonas_salina.1
MGADGAFERRKVELEFVKQREVSEEEVVESFREEVDPEGSERVVLRYLEQGQLGYIYGKSLFVHGGVTETNMGTIPGREGRVENVGEWIESLNAWAAREVEAFKRNPKAGKNSKERAGHGLMDYALHCGNGGKTVICSSHLKDGNATPVPVDVQRYLLKGNIERLVVGHVPHGDCPTVIRSGDVAVVMADTSYSKMGHKTTEKDVRGQDFTWVDNRGDAVSEVLVYLDGSVK